MKAFALFKLLTTVRRIESLATHLSAGGVGLLRDDLKQKLADNCKNIQTLCKECGLTSAADQVARISSALGGGSSVSFDELRVLWADLLNRIEDESKRQVVMTIDSEFAKKYFQNPQFFDADDLTVSKVSIQFPSASEDIAEAGRCLACDRATACVMHLSRVLEVGLRSLAAALGINPQNDWGKYLIEIERKLEARVKSSGARSADEQFYSESWVTFDAIRRAWRNPTMHVDRMYSPERAEEILISVRSFMRHLATKLQESP